MCTLLFALDAHPRYRVVLAANRDEFHARPARGAGFWAEAPEVFAGRDLQACGTWFGVTLAGRWAALTNIRDPKDIRPGAPSRGELVAEFLRGGAPAEAYVRGLAGERYAGFNLVVCDEEGAWYLSNRAGGPRRLGPGVYGVSNALLDVPWPKVERGKAGLRALLEREEIGAEALLGLLADRGAAPDAALPDTGVGLALERALSPLFIDMPGYGTRASTAMLVETGGYVVCRELATSPGAIPGGASVGFQARPRG